MAMKVDYGMVRKVTMSFKFEDFLFCVQVGNWTQKIIIL
jgi:hypothetical protein